MRIKDILSRGFLIWAFIFNVVLASTPTDEEGTNREEKIILFDVVKFQNMPCNGNEKADNRVGTCYAPRECREKNGTGAGECAQGYGVCCVFDLECGVQHRENITHWISPPEASQLTGRCDAKMCKLNENICQFRLDWTSFVIAGPSTNTATTHFTSFGVPVAAGTPSRRAQTNIGQCIRDTFNVRPSYGIKVPTICGINTGQHIYIDASDATFDDCTTLSFNFKEPEPTRNWNMTIIQIPCDYGNKAPPGCLQFYFGFTGDNAQGVIQSFNFNGGYHLADQNQYICIRRETNRCAICYSQIDNRNWQDFGISSGKRRACTYFRNGQAERQSTCNQGLSLNQQRSETLMTHTGFIRGSFQNCGNYGLHGKGSDYDFVHIPKPVVAAEILGRDGNGFSDVLCGNGNFCGRNTSGPGFCSRSVPFDFRFVSDSSEGEFEHHTAAPNNRRGPLPHGSRGFRFGYLQRKCREDVECFQCSMLSRTNDQCLLVDGNTVTIRGFEGFICLELPTAGSEDQVYLTVSVNDVCTATDPSDPSATRFTDPDSGKQQVLSVSAGSDGKPSDLEGTALVRVDSDTTPPILWLRSEVDADGCFFLQHKTSGKLFTLEPFVTERLIEIGQAGNFGGGILRLHQQSNVINNELSCFGPHLHPSGTSGYEFKIYQPFEGPSIPCDRDSYTSETGSGTIKYPDSGNYERNLNCYFRITVPDGKKVKINFKNIFDVQDGTFISNLRFSNLPEREPTDRVTCKSGDTVTQASCGECPKPTTEKDPNCEGGGDCEVVKFFTSFDPVKFNPKSEYFCTNKGVTIGTWCNGYGDFLQVDHKTMVDYSDIGSKQNRFCGSSTSQLWMFDAISSDLQSKDGTISISNFAGIDAFPVEGSTDSVSVFRAEPFLGLTNDDTADGTVVIFEGSSTDDSHTWQRSADAADGCSAGYFTITNKASGTLLTKISDTGNLLICAASTSTSTSTDCVSDSLGDAQCWMIDSTTMQLKNKLGFSIETGGVEVRSFTIPAAEDEGSIQRTDNFLTVANFNAKGNVITDATDSDWQNRIRQVVFLAENIPDSDSQMWTRGTADADGCFRMENQGELLTTSGSSFKVQGDLIPPMYTSDTNELIIWMKTNLDDTVGTGFELDWTTVDA